MDHIYNYMYKECLSVNLFYEFCDVNHNRKISLVEFSDALQKMKYETRDVNVIQQIFYLFSQEK